MVIGSPAKGFALFETSLARTLRDYQVELGP